MHDDQDDKITICQLRDALPLQIIIVRFEMLVVNVGCVSPVVHAAASKATSLHYRGAVL